MKLRLDVETERWPGGTVSPLAARHIEHPGSRHSKPASVKSLSSPSATASRLTVSEPGTTQARTPGATLRPRATSAAARKSLTEIIVSFVIRLDQTHLGAELDRKIADGKPPFDREVANGAAGIFHGVTSPARGADVTDQREDEILGGHAEWQPALEHHAHCFWPALDDGLCCQHMRQLARPDTEGQRAQPAMRAGVAVAADDQATGKAEAKFGSDDMDNALPGLVDIEHLDASGRRLGPQAREQFLSYLARAGPTRVPRYC